MTQIQWFPGHMAKARRQVEEKLKLVDIVYELLDARIPLSSRNPLINEITRKKPRLIILNKADLADPAETRKFIDHFASRGEPALAVNSLTGSPLPAIMSKTNEILRALREKESKKGMKPRPFRGMVLGIPNVGKSQFINRLAGKNKAKTGDIPGITRMQVYLRAGNDLELLDNPGILWPRFESETVAKHLALVGSIKEEVFPLEEVALYGIGLLASRYPARLKERYGIPSVESAEPLTLLEDIGKVRGCLLAGGLIDHERVCKLFLHDFRHLMFGPLSIERVTDDGSL